MLLASLTIVNVPVIGLPATVGLKVTVIWQVAPGATGLAQVPRVAVKAALPPNVNAEMFSGAVPELVTVSKVFVVEPTGCRPTANVAGSAPMVGVMPAEPVRVATVVPTALTTVIVAVFTPGPDATVGANRTVSVQNVPPAPRVLTHPAIAGVTVNWLASAPPRVALVTANAPAEVLRSARVWAAEVVPRFCVANVSDPGVNVIPGGSPVPVTITVLTGVTGSFVGMFTVAVFAPAEVGRKATLTVHVALEATGAAQPLVARNDRYD